MLSSVVALAVNCRLAASLMASLRIAHSLTTRDMTHGERLICRCDGKELTASMFARSHFRVAASGSMEEDNYLPS